MDADLDTLATALYVKTDDLLKESPHRPARQTLPGGLRSLTLVIGRPDDPLSGSPLGAAHPRLLPVVRWLRHQVARLAWASSEVAAGNRHEPVTRESGDDVSFVAWD